MNKIKQIILILFLVSSGCQENTKTVQKDFFRPNLVALFVEDIDISLKWYNEKLGFEVEKEIEDYPDYGLKLAFLKSNGFHLEIIEKTNSFQQSEVLLNEEKYLGGIFKIGLKTNDLENIYNQLKEFEDVEFVTSIGELPENQLPINWPTKHFLIKDPDGNFIQFFDSGATRKVSPWLFMVTVDNLENSISWYSENLGFKHHQTIGKEGNRRAVLERNTYVLELFEPNNVVKADKISVDSTILGFKKIAFGVEDLTSLSAVLEKENVEIITPLENCDFEWADKAMIVKDLEGNWTQLFEIKE